jgi:hypothetical protein
MTVRSQQAAGQRASACVVVPRPIAIASPSSTSIAASAPMADFSPRAWRLFSTWDASG